MHDHNIYYLVIIDRIFVFVVIKAYAFFLYLWRRFRAYKNNKLVDHLSEKCFTDSFAFSLDQFVMMT